MIRRADSRDVEAMWAIISDAAIAYKGVIPPDLWQEPYMSRSHLRRALDRGVLFHVYLDAGEIAGVMGIQRVRDIALIRHAYVKPDRQREGIGGLLLARIRLETDRPLLVGTWAQAGWAIQFYEKHGFSRLRSGLSASLLRRYWTIPERQVQTSVVLADQAWHHMQRSNPPRPANGVLGSPDGRLGPERMVRYCGADCGQCETYHNYLVGDPTGVVNPETGFRCCWLPAGYHRGRDCPIKVCCESKSILYCGECPGFDRCTRMRSFYQQAGYERLRRRMLHAVERRQRRSTSHPQ